MKHYGLLLTVCVLLVSACSTERPQETKAAPVFVGTVDNVYSPQGYVLVRLSGSIPKEGTVLISQSPEEGEITRSANLIVSAERLGGLRVPADIRSGTVMKGDYVYLYRDLAPPAEASGSDDDDGNPLPPVDDSVDVFGAEGNPEQPVVDLQEDKSNDIKDMLENIPSTYDDLIKQ